MERRYGHYASFAVWDKDINNTQAIYDNIDLLHGKIVFVGYNASAQIKVFQNFHKRHPGGRDCWLAESIGKHKIFIGAYMTDFFKGDYATRENGVITSKKIIDKNNKIFEEEIRLITKRKPILILMGRRTENILYRLGYNCKYSCIHTPHFASHISKKKFFNEISKLSRKIKGI